jgi:hypothetical protein
MLKLKKSLFVVAGLMLATALVGAQAAQSPVKKVRQQITFSQDFKVGSTVLKSGKYEVSSSDQGITFRKMVQDVAYTGQWNYDMKEKPVVVKATVTVLEAKSRGTLMDMPTDNSGVRVLKAITLDDTNVKFTFEQ